MVKPVKAVRMTARVDISGWVRPKGSLRAHSATMLAVMVSAAGMHMRMTFRMNLPFSRSRLVSSARMKEGTPMVRVLMRVCWMGSKG